MKYTEVRWLLKETSLMTQWAILDVGLQWVLHISSFSFKRLFVVWHWEVELMALCLNSWPRQVLYHLSHTPFLFFK
jgi:hypothetical protein